MSTADEVYAGIVHGLAQSEKLHLATIILEDLSQTAGPVLDFSDSWSTEDIRDVSDFAKKHASAAYPEATDLA